MKTYTTKQGDMWDSISYMAYGSTDYTGKLIKANQSHSETYIFPAGVELQIPDMNASDVGMGVKPPWRI